MSALLWMSRLIGATKANQTVGQAAYLYHKKCGQWPNFPGIPRQNSSEWGRRVQTVWPWLGRDVEVLKGELERRGLRIEHEEDGPHLRGNLKAATLDIIVACKLHKAALMKEHLTAKNGGERG